MKKKQKPIAIILIVSLVLGFSFFFVKPQKAQALDGGGSWAQVTKEIVLDAIGWVVSDVILKRLESKIIAWGRGEESDGNVPLAVSDYADYFLKALALGTAEYIADFDALWDETDRFEKDVRDTLENLGVTTLYQDMRYSQYARPTLQSDIDYNYQAFINSGYSFRYGGWNSWFSMIKPENNIFGQYLMAVKARRDYEQARKEAAGTEVNIGGGYPNETITTLDSVEKCKNHCEDTYGATDFVTQEAYQSCIARCDRRMGVPLEKTAKNLGTTIEKLSTDALGKDFSRIISADEISELIGIFFSSVMNKAIDGLGLGFSAKTTTDSSTIARAGTQEQYAYRRNFKKNQSDEEVKDFKSTLLTNILKSVQQLSRSIVACDKKTMMKADDYAKNLSDIFTPNVEALYVSLEGVNLKPDFQVLDGHSVPYSVYGYSWNQLPYQKFPSKCKKITDQLSLGNTATCKDIVSGLEPDNYIDSRCGQCVYDGDTLNCPFGPVPPFSKDVFPSEAELQDKADFYNSCKGPYNVVLDRCEDCIKKADARCNQGDSDQRDECIRTTCDDISNNTYATGTDGLEFYGKCLIEETKESCNTCLREYFIPADYCHQIEDYVARSVAKYPAVVLTSDTDKSFLSGVFKVGKVFWSPITALITALSKPNNGMFVGPKDEYIKDMGGKCNDNVNPSDISTALFCRIMPGFEYKGEKVCETRCDVTETELQDITDFKPGHYDCDNGDQLPIGGQDPGNFIKGGVLRMRGKCCAALWMYDEENYKVCLGEGTPTPEESSSVCDWGISPDEEPACYCNEGYRPLGFTRTGGDEKGDRGGDCSDFTFESTGGIVYGYTGNHPRNDVVYIANDACQEGQPGEQWDATGPSNVIWETETPIADTPETYNNIDLTGQSGTLHSGVYHNDSSDEGTSWHLCAPCNLNDAAYPEYGTGIDQCAGKI